MKPLLFFMFGNAFAEAMTISYLRKLAQAQIDAQRKAAGIVDEKEIYQAQLKVVGFSSTRDERGGKIATCKPDNK